MATYNFHFRVIPEPAANTTNVFHWAYDYPSDEPRAYTTSVYDVSEELFVLYPRRDFDTFFNKTPTNTTTNLYEFRVANGVRAITDLALETNLYDLNFGDINTTIENKLILGVFNFLGQSGKFFNSVIQIGNGAWTTSNWSISNISTFKNEIATFLAKCCDNSRTLTGIYTQPLSTYSDFAVQIYKNGYRTSGVGTEITFVVFYPGNDPEADDIVTVTT